MVLSLSQLQVGFPDSMPNYDPDKGARVVWVDLQGRATHPYLLVHTAPGFNRTAHATNKLDEASC